MKFKKFAKNSIILSQVFYALRGFRYSLTLFKYGKKDIQNDLILFNNFNGRGYGGNPKAIAEEFHRLYPDKRLAWTYAGNSARESLPEYIMPVKHQSQEYFETMAVSKVWVFNVLPPKGTIKRKEQIYVQTWHGDRPLKKILKDAADDSSRYRDTLGYDDLEAKLCDYFISGSSWFSRVWRRASGYKGTILEYGMPRNDCLIRIDKEENNRRVQRFRERYNIPSNAKTLLYAPTFRDHILDDERMDNSLDLTGVLTYLVAKDHCMWVCLVRGHRGSRLNVNNRETEYIDVTSYPDMADVLMTSDLLITDYSSCAGDFALLHRPVILYQDDCEEYTEKDRKLYFPMNETPYYTALNMHELYSILDSLSDETVYKNCEDILSFYEVKESGNSGETVCRIITEKMSEGCAIHEKRGY